MQQIQEESKKIKIIITTVNCTPGKTQTPDPQCGAHFSSVRATYTKLGSHQRVMMIVALTVDLTTEQITKSTYISINGLKVFMTQTSL